MRHVVLGEVYF